MPVGAAEVVVGMMVKPYIGLDWIGCTAGKASIGYTVIGSRAWGRSPWQQGQREVGRKLRCVTVED